MLLFGAALLAQEPAPETVVARVDGKDVTVADVRAMAATAPPNLVELFRTNPKYAIEQVFVLRHLAAEGARRKLDEQSPFKEQLEFMRANALAGAELQYESNNLAVGAEEIEQFYAKNTARFEKAKIQVIYIGFRGGDQPAAHGATAEAVKEAAKRALEQAHVKDLRAEAEAKAKAESLVKQLRAGADFEKLVAQHSEDPVSKGNQGDWGVIARGDNYPEELKTAVFALKPGEISDPVKQPNAYYIIRLVEKTTQPLTEARAAIVREVRQAKFQQWFTDLRKKYEAKIEKPEFFAKPLK